MYKLMTQVRTTELSTTDWGKIKSEQLTLHPLSDLTDELLVLGCLAGDDEAWRVLLERYGKLIFTVAYSFNFPTTIVEEVYQDVCLQAIRKMYTLQDRSKLQAWLVTIAKRLCMQRKRKMKQVVLGSEYLEEIFAENTVLEETVIRHETQSLLEEALSKLGDRCRYIIEALFLADPKIPYDEVAEVLGIAEGSVGPIRQRCLIRLRDLILEIEEGNKQT